MTANDISVFALPNRVAADTQAQLLRLGGYEVSEVLEANLGVSWSNETVTPSIQDGAVVPAWIVIGRR